MRLHRDAPLRRGPARGSRRCGAALHAAPRPGHDDNLLRVNLRTAHKHASAFSRRDAPELCVSFTLFENRGRRESRAPIAPAVVRTMSARVDHGSTGSFRLSPREWVTAYSVLSPVTGLFATVALRMTD